MTPETELLLEHSLVSLHKWESKWKKPYMQQKGSSPKELLDYIRCMAIDSEPSDEVLLSLTQDQINQIGAYNQDSMTATTFGKDAFSSGAREIVTAEVIYYWMIALGIPMECQYWHLNKLLTLINVCNLKNAPKTKKNKKTAAAQRRALNESRLAALGTRG